MLLEYIPISNGAQRPGRGPAWHGRCLLNAFKTRVVHYLSSHDYRIKPRSFDKRIYSNILRDYRNTYCEDLL